MVSISDDLDALEEALAAGPTPGPWSLRGSYASSESNLTHITSPSFDRIAVTAKGPDAGFIVACSPERIRRLLDALKQKNPWEEALVTALDAKQARLSKACELLGKARAEIRDKTPRLSAVTHDITDFLKEVGHE